MRDNFNKESTNVLIIGKSGVGKSSLVNYLFGKELQPVGVGAPVTKMQIKEFTYKYDKHFEMHIYDTWGLEPSTQKAELWKKKIFDEIARHDKESISEWFNTIIFCLNAKSSRIEDFELDIMEQLLREKNHLTIALTHCRSKEDPDGIILRKSIREELEKRGIDSLEDRNFVFVSNVKKALLGGSVEQFGKEEIFELLKKPDKLKWIVPFMKEIRINRLEQEINKNCDAFIRDLVTEINEMYRNAIAYYSELSRKYAIVGFQMNRGDYDTSAKLHFDAMHTVEDQVAADLKLLRKRMRFMNDILSDKKVESTLRDTIISFKILIKDTNKIREDLKAELERFMEAVKQQLEEHLSEIEASLNSLEIDDLYTFQM